MDMGSGRFPSAGSNWAAYIRQPQSFDGSTWNNIANNPYWDTSPGSGYETWCYHVGNIFNDPVQGKKFYLGGPGTNGTTCF
jgi:neprosin-like protein